MRTETRKPWKGVGMEGWIARWYTRTRQKDIQDFRNEARRIASRLPPGARVLEVAPGPGFFAIELARLGAYRIAALDISRTFVAIATEHARTAGVAVDFQWGSASAMPFADASFDFIYCSAAFKNFSQPVQALDEMYRVLRPGGEAMIVDLRKDVPLDEVRAYVEASGRSRIDQWLTRWTFEHVLIKRALAAETFRQVATESRFRGAELTSANISLQVGLSKPALAAVAI